MQRPDCRRMTKNPLRESSPKHDVYQPTRERIYMRSRQMAAPDKAAKYQELLYPSKHPTSWQKKEVAMTHPGLLFLSLVFLG